MSCGVDQPTDNPKILIDIATKLIEKLYVEGVAFKKCGVILTGLEPKSSFNHDLFANKDQDQKSDNLLLFYFPPRMKKSTPYRRRILWLIFRCLIGYF